MNREQLEKGQDAMRARQRLKGSLALSQPRESHKPMCNAPRALPSARQPIPIIRRKPIKGSKLCERRFLNTFLADSSQKEPIETTRRIAEGSWLYPEDNEGVT